MFYFDTLPKIVTRDQNGTPIVLTNLIARARLIEELRNNPMLFYEYAIQDGDTPEIVAEKYYGDPYRYWIVLLSNELLNPLWDWPLDYNSFLDYINTKYETDATTAGMTPFQYTNTEIYSYNKIIKITNDETEDQKIIQITQSDYNSLVPSNTTYTVANTNVTVSITKETKTIFDYEYDLNESRRQIKVLNNTFVGNFEESFASLMKVR